MREVSATRALIIAFGAVVLAFVAATAYAEYRSFAISQLAQQIANHDAPAIERLAAGRSDLRRLRNARGDELREAWQSARSDLLAARSLPRMPGDESARAELSDALAQLSTAVDAAVTAGLPLSDEAAREPIGRVLRAELTLLEMHAAQVRAAAVAIEDVRSTAMWIAFLLDGIAAVATIVMARLLIEFLRRQARLREEQHRLVAEKAAELEQFSGRLAHDIAGPVSAAAMSIDLAATALSAEQQKTFLLRARRSLARVSEISRALLEFARSGAHPDGNGRCNARFAIEAVIEETQPLALNLGVAISIACDGDAEVVCGPAILTTMLANLVQNAIKYGRGIGARRVIVRATNVGSSVRFEVEDNGLGVPPELEKAVFDPYVRAPGSHQSGIGLGLATVKRLATAHGGRVGVHNRPGEGCSFWFELPVAEPLR